MYAKYNNYNRPKTCCESTHTFNLDEETIRRQVKITFSDFAGTKKWWSGVFAIIDRSQNVCRMNKTDQD